MTARRIVILLAVAALVAVAAVVAWRLFWVSGGHDAARLAASAPARCIEGARPADDLVWIAGGRFAMGDTIYPEEGPVRVASVDGFWIDRYEVTNDEFAAFVAATGYVTVAERPVDVGLHPGLPAELQQPGAVVFIMPNDVDGMGDISQWWQYVPGANWRHPGGPSTSIDGRGDFPVTAVAYEDALAYARWKGRELPTEAQWEWAAKKDMPDEENRRRPKGANTWQGLFPVVNTAEDGFVGIAPVGCFAPNASGLHDMIGNLWEWTADIYDGDPARRVIKGGSYLCAQNYCVRYRPAARQPQEADLATTHLGFRTVLNAPGP